MSLPFLRVTLGRERQSTVLSSDNRAAILHQTHKHTQKECKVQCNITLYVLPITLLFYIKYCIVFACTVHDQ